MSLDAAATQDLSNVDLSPARFGQGIPFDDLRRLRSQSPVWWSDDLGCWVVTSYEMVERCNRDWTTFSSSDGVVDPSDAGAPKWRPITGMDPPEHTAYRRAVLPPFTPKPIERLHQLVSDIVADALASFLEAGGGDFAVEMAAAIPYRVIASMTGAALEDERQVIEWTNRLLPNEDPDYRPSPEAAGIARQALGDYCLALTKEQRSGPRAPLAEQLFETRLGDRPLTDDEIANFIDTFIVGGTETTRQLLSQGFLALLEHPEQGARLADGSVGLEPVIEELLRWTSPVLQHSRRATRTVIVAGKEIHEGDRLTLWIVSANRDERIFANPDTLDLGRHPNPHVTLGAGGPHHCLGAHLARLEARVLFDQLRPHLGRFALARPPVRVPSNFFNGLKQCEVTVD